MSPAPLDELQWPPGLAGRLAWYIFNISQRPVREVSIAAALALLAGVCGRAFTVNGTGLNQYWIVVARSAVGKEAIGDGITALIDLVEDVHGAKNLVAQVDFASGQALHKEILMRPSFVQVAGEFGRKLKLMAKDQDGPYQTLRTVMTKAYSKSGPGQWMEGMSYSNNENNLPAAKGHAYSFIGETTPGSFSQGLSSGMMEDGFLSRFNIMPYEGERPAANIDTTAELEPDELSGWRDLVVRVMPYVQPMSAPARIDVSMNRDAEERLCKRGRFDLECDEEIRRLGDDESQRQMWNRAHLKALRIAAVLAAADNPVLPMMTLAHAVWAITTVKRDIAAMKKLMGAGEVGGDDHARIELIKAAIHDYFYKPVPISYRIPEGMRDAGIITYSYIHLRVIKKAAFSTNEPKGSISLLEAALRSLTDQGLLMLTDKNKTLESYAFSGKCYRKVG